jgi:hypothetical protein
MRRLSLRTADQARRPLRKLHNDAGSSAGGVAPSSPSGTSGSGSTSAAVSSLMAVKGRWSQAYVTAFVRPSLELLCELLDEQVRCALAEGD